MTDPVSSVGSELRLQNWVRNHTQAVKKDITMGGPARALPDGTQDAMLQAVEQITLDGLHKHGYVNHGMSRTEMIRIFLGLNGADGIIKDADSTALSSITGFVRDNICASGYIDHAVPASDLMRIIQELAPQTSQETDFDMNVPIATAVAELCADVIEKYYDAAVSAYPTVSLEVLQ